MAHFISKVPWHSDSPKQKGSKTARAKTSIIVSDVNDKERKRIVHTSAGDVVFEQGMAHLPNDARGNDIVAEYKSMALDPNQVAVAKNRPTRWRDSVHNYFFQVPALPWKEEASE
jgi:hypothetical protein